MTNTIDIDSTVESSGIIPVFNPSNEEQIAEVPDSDRATVDAAVEGVHFRRDLLSLADASSRAIEASAR